MQYLALPSVLIDGREGLLRSQRRCVVDGEIEAATAAYLKDDGALPFASKSGHAVDVAKAVEMHL